MGPLRCGDFFGKPLKYAIGRKLEGSEEGVAMATRPQGPIGPLIYHIPQD